MGLDAMLYLCKSCYTYTKQQGIFFDRGDPGAPDFQIGVLTLNAAWHDLDLSAIIPEGTHLVLIRLELVNAFIGTAFEMRNKDNINDQNSAKFLIPVAGIECYTTFLVTPDSNRVIQYWGAGVGWVVVDIIIGGWSY